MPSNSSGQASVPDHDRGKAHAGPAEQERLQVHRSHELPRHGRRGSMPSPSGLRRSDRDAPIASTRAVGGDATGSIGRDMEWLVRSAPPFSSPSERKRSFHRAGGLAGRADAIPDAFDRFLDTARCGDRMVR